jgi:hypothetical protein
MEASFPPIIVETGQKQRDYGEVLTDGDAEVQDGTALDFLFEASQVRK